MIAVTYPERRARRFTPCSPSYADAAPRSGRTSRRGRKAADLLGLLLKKRLSPALRRSRSTVWPSTRHAGGRPAGADGVRHDDDVPTGSTKPSLATPTPPTTTTVDEAEDVVLTGAAPRPRLGRREEFDCSTSSHLGRGQHGHEPTPRPAPARVTCATSAAGGGTGTTSGSSSSPSTATPRRWLPSCWRSTAWPARTRRAALRRHGRRRARALQARVPGRPGPHPVRIMLATDAASEGIDLQNHCHRLVNYDLPFNPNRLEQRTGRIDRYGQQTARRRLPLRRQRLGDRAVDACRATCSSSPSSPARSHAARDLGSVNPVISDAVERRMLGRPRRLQHRSTVAQARANAAPGRAQSARGDPPAGGDPRQQPPRAALHPRGHRAGGRHRPGARPPARWPDLEDRTADDVFDVAAADRLLGAATGLADPRTVHGSGPHLRPGRRRQARRRRSRAPRPPARRDGHPAAAGRGVGSPTPGCTGSPPCCRTTRAGRRARGRVLPVRARRRGRCTAARGGAARRWLDARARPLPALGELRRAARGGVPRAGERRPGTAAHPRAAGGALAGRPRRRAGRDRLADECRERSLERVLAEHAQEEQERIADRLDRFAQTLRCKLAEDDTDLEQALISRAEAGKSRDELAQYRRDRRSWAERLDQLPQDRNASWPPSRAATPTPSRTVPGGGRLCGAATGGRAMTVCRGRAEGTVPRPSTRSASTETGSRWSRSPARSCPCRCCGRPGRRSNRSTRSSATPCAAPTARGATTSPRGSAAGSSSCWATFLAGATICGGPTPRT